MQLQLRLVVPAISLGMYEAAVRAVLKAMVDYATPAIGFLEAKMGKTRFGGEVP